MFITLKYIYYRFLRISSNNLFKEHNWLEKFAIRKGRSSLIYLGYVNMSSISYGNTRCL